MGVHVTIEMKFRRILETTNFAFESIESCRATSGTRCLKD